jgi:hypothetical protein
MKTEEIKAIPKIDAHAHLVGTRASGEDRLAGLLERHNFGWLDICWYESDESLARQVKLARRYRSRYPGRFSWVTTFSLSGFRDKDWVDRAIASVEADRAAGAVGVKVWKNIGMELKDAGGRFVMIDDPRLEPLLERIEKLDMTLAAHIGEPRNCWLPVEEMTVEGDRSYYRTHPEYHGKLHPEIPGYREQVDARDRLLQRHPRLRVVGCHLGSLEYDVAEMARRLDAYPRLALDMAARICHLQVQDRDAVRDFLIRYQDRLLYGTDAGWEVDARDLSPHLEALEQTYLSDYRYFATSEMVEAPFVAPGFRCRGLELPSNVLERLYFGNARRWYPGIGER